MIDSLAIYTKMLELLAWTFQKVNTFPKKQRFVLGQQIENSALTCLRLIIEANNASIASDKIAKLHALNVELDMLRSLLRVAQQLNFMSARSLAYSIEQIDEIGRMRGGWARRYQNK